jgi:hypothetical protein
MASTLESNLSDELDEFLVLHIQLVDLRLYLVFRLLQLVQLRTISPVLLQYVRYIYSIQPVWYVEIEIETAYIVYTSTGV